CVRTSRRGVEKGDHVTDQRRRQTADGGEARDDESAATSVDAGRSGTRRSTASRPRLLLAMGMSSYIVLLLSIGQFAPEEISAQESTDIHVNEPEGDILIFMTGQDDIEKLVSKLEEKIRNLEAGSCMDAIVLPLHGSLPPEMQASATVQVKCKCATSSNHKQQSAEKQAVELRRTEDGLTGTGSYRGWPPPPPPAGPPPPNVAASASMALCLLLRWSPSSSSHTGCIRHTVIAIYEAICACIHNSWSIWGHLSLRWKESNECGCSPQALTIAAMLSVEGTLLPGRRYNSENVT
ncbi:hypothetical protein Ccrd_006013, partial [Cynara cardunculus var. scolymus]